MLVESGAAASWRGAKNEAFKLRKSSGLAHCVGPMDRHIGSTQRSRWVAYCFKGDTDDIAI